ncbi:MAG: hypothetical protein QOI06_486 [Nocardioidaceae bacterium]|nr:hypothetical protein [Nocardioidaceae bacterium]
MTDPRRESAVIAAIYREWALEQPTGRTEHPGVEVAKQDGVTPSQYPEGETLLTASRSRLDDLHARIAAAL